MEDFVIILQHDKLRSYRRMALLILLLHVAYFTYYLLKMDTGIPVIATLLITVGALVVQIMAVKKNTKPIAPVSIAFILLSIAWFFFQNYWLGAAMIVLAFLDLIAGRKLAVFFSSDRILFPSFPKKTIQWQELNNAILKDRILTIDFKNDRLLQAMIAEESFGIDEELFNAFCRKQFLQAGL